MDSPDSKIADLVVEPYPVLEQKVRHRGRVFTFVSDTVALPAGQVVRDYIAHPGAVAIVALRQRQELEVLLVRQYRHPVHAYLWEIPAGLKDKPGEASLESAKRELAEEADLTAENWKFLFTIYNTPGSSSESLDVYLATEIEELPEKFAREEEEAEMISAWVPLAKTLEMIRAGELSNATTVAALQGAALEMGIGLPR